MESRGRNEKMTNYEFYKEDLIPILSQTLAKVEGKPRNCQEDISCADCEFPTNNCVKEAEKWLKAEYKGENNEK